MPPLKRADPFFLDIIKNPEKRLANQAERRSPPSILQQKILRTLTEGKPRPKVGNLLKATVGQSVQRMEIHALDDRNEDLGYIQALFNPETVEHMIKVNWAEPAIIGLPFKPQHYTGTDSREVKFELRWDVLAYMNRAGFDYEKGMKEVARARAFIEAISTPRKNAQGIAGSAPPRLLIFWPNYMSLVCNLYSVPVKDAGFEPTGRLREFTATFDVKEVGDVTLLTFEALKESGPKRQGMLVDKLGLSSAGKSAPATRR